MVGATGGPELAPFHALIDWRQLVMGHEGVKRWKEKLWQVSVWSVWSWRQVTGSGGEVVTCSLVEYMELAAGDWVRGTNDQFLCWLGTSQATHPRTVTEPLREMSPQNV